MSHKKKTGIEWLIGLSFSWKMNIIFTLLVFGLFLFAWSTIVRMDPHPNARGALLFRYSRPYLVVEYVINNWHGLLENASVSTLHVLVGILVGALGFPLGMWVTINPRVSGVIQNIFAIVAAYSKLGVVILLVAWFGHQGYLIYVVNIYIVLILTFIIGFRGGIRILSDDGAVPKDTLRATVLDFKNRRELFWRYMLPSLKYDWISALLFCSMILWPMLLFVEPTINISGAGLGNAAWASGVEEISMEAFYANSGLIAILNLITWGVLYLVERVV